CSHRQWRRRTSSCRAHSASTDTHAERSEWRRRGCTRLGSCSPSHRTSRRTCPTGCFHSQRDPTYPGTPSQLLLVDRVEGFPCRAGFHPEGNSSFLLER
ncbi:hypothetical protein PMAYCL1PPCAC_08800, partial [Pristionchus mayeri]